MSNRALYYRLDADEAPVPIENDDVLTWARSFEATERWQLKTRVWGRLNVSTVFLGMDHSFGEDGPPILFETMIFGWPLDDCYMRRYATAMQARQGHARAVHVAKWWPIAWLGYKLSEVLAEWKYQRVYERQNGIRMTKLARWGIGVAALNFLFGCLNVAVAVVVVPHAPLPNLGSAALSFFVTGMVLMVVQQCRRNRW